MTLMKQYFKAAMVGIAALVVAATLIAYGVSIAEAQQPYNMLGLAASGSVVLLGIMFIGVPLIIFFGAPLFVFLLRRESATLPMVLVIGAAPAILVAPFILDLALMCLPFGLMVAAVVRWACGQGSNHSSKPEPLRSAT